MSKITREQAYRRWKKGEDPHKLAKEMGITRERMSHILKKMDASVPLVDRIEELEAKLRVITERSNEVELANVELGEKLAKAVEFTEVVVRCAYGALWDKARTALAELKGQDDE